MNYDKIDLRHNCIFLKLSGKSKTIIKLSVVPLKELTGPGQLQKIGCFWKSQKVEQKVSQKGFWDAATTVMIKIESLALFKNYVKRTRCFYVSLLDFHTFDRLMTRCQKEGVVLRRTH